MTAILHENYILIRNSLKFVPKVLINDMQALFWMMVRHQTGDKPLSEPVVQYLTDACMCHSATMNQDSII